MEYQNQLGVELCWQFIDSREIVDAVGRKLCLAGTQKNLENFKSRFSKSMTIRTLGGDICSVHKDETLIYENDIQEITEVKTYNIYKLYLDIMSKKVFDWLKSHVIDWCFLGRVSNLPKFG